MHFYPEAGGAMSGRGTFPSGTQQAFEAANARYNDTPTMQLFILFGFDYVIFRVHAARAEASLEPNLLGRSMPYGDPPGSRRPR